MEIIKWAGYEWLTRERWGQVHPDKPWNWYDPDCVEVNNNTLSLGVKYHPKIFDNNNNPITSKYGTGLVCCEKDFGFGTFQIEAKLPKGRGLWPAFWLYPVNAYPPEIDIFEGYSGKRNYKTGCFLKPYKVESCTHSKLGLGQPTRRPWFWQLSNPSESFNTYMLLWTPDRLTFWINDKEIRVITDKKVLSELSKYKMRLVINNHIDPKYVDNFNIETPFLIKRFLYIGW